MNLGRIFSTLLCVLILGSCHPKLVQTNNTAVSKKNEPGYIKSIIIDAKASSVEPGDAFAVDSLKINSDTLSLFVNYGGGCKEHSFDLYSSGAMAKSLPPQITMILKHNGHDDKCKMQIIQELKFNIAQLKKSGYEEIVLRIGDLRVSYFTK